MGLNLYEHDWNGNSVHIVMSKGYGKYRNRNKEYVDINGVGGRRKNMHYAVPLEIMLYVCVLCSRVGSISLKSLKVSDIYSRT